MSLPGTLRNTSNQQLPLAGRAVVITGVSRRRGIGFSVARRLTAMGASLFLHSWSAYDAAQQWGSDPDGPHALAHDLSAIGVKVESMEADLRSPGAPARLLAAAVHSLGHIDILIANHAYSTSGSIVDVTAEDIDAHLQINVRATLLLVQEFVAQHDGRRGGRVVVMTSGQHLEPMPEIAYVASKGTLHQLTKSLSHDLVRRGITVNTINPGATDTGYATPTNGVGPRDAEVRRRPRTPAIRQAAAPPKTWSGCSCRKVPPRTSPSGGASCRSPGRRTHGSRRCPRPCGKGSGP